MAKKTVNQIKDDQGYTKDAPKCSNCAYFSSEFETIKNQWNPSTYQKEVNKRCALGGFACQKATWCKKHVFAE